MIHKKIVTGFKQDLESGKIGGYPAIIFTQFS